MKLRLKNIGKLGSASVELNGITVIAGPNDTGKSTVGRALFAMLHSFCNAQEKIRRMQVDSVSDLLSSVYMRSSHNYARPVDTTEAATSVVAHIDELRSIEQQHHLKQQILELVSQYDAGLMCSFADEVVQKATEDLNSILSISDTRILNDVLERMLNAEFNHEVRNFFAEDDGELDLQLRDTSIKVSIVSADHECETQMTKCVKR